MEIKFTTGGEVQKAGSAWYRGENCNFNPTKKVLRADGGLEEFVLRGWLPAKPFLTRDMRVSAFGSCFAQNVSKWLMRQRYQTGERLYALERGRRFVRIPVIRFGEGIVNTFALRQQFEWAFENKRFSEDLWHGSKGELAEYNEKVKNSTLQMFQSTDVFIITLGPSEVWHNIKTGEVFWRAIPVQQFDPKMHGFRVSTVEENRENLEKIYSIIRKMKPEAPVIFTLSPVPLVATFRPVSCITANSVSKAILRVAIDEVMRGKRGDDKLYYWPSYEIIKDYYQDAYEEDNRHPREDALNCVMQAFSRHYLVDPYPLNRLQELADGLLARLSGIENLDRSVVDFFLSHGIYQQELRDIPQRNLARLMGSADLAEKIKGAMR